ncbi:Y-family DNA polymerase [Paraburkholderia domus]|uniref:Y-family DNA polymerase n=1 Tax=Paraburkholderia domus TaxID=2793075 RepID=UPI00191330C3|nr:DNA polymerase Y family protein [Paraburkholderia domus]MBK5065751.1 DNA polymerase Y family protein [Burkholderia sp. R-70199]CAE6962667.1 Protein ImuB [Paraburkholderia domus]
MRVFFAVHLPKLPLEVFRPSWSPEPLHGCAVLEKEKVVIADRAARAAGVRMGMKRAGVVALSPDTQMHDRDVNREASALRDVGVALMRFSPELALVDDASLVVEIGASLRLSGGLRALCRQARSVLATLGLTARISTAPTGQGAWLLAKFGNRRVLKLTSLEKQLATLPMIAVPEVQRFADWFGGLGCETIADIRRLPRAGLQRRCGEHLLDSLDRAFGTAPELFEWLELPPTFSARIEMPDRLEHADGALFGAHRLIVQLCGWLCGLQLAVTALRLVLEHERGRDAIEPTAIAIALGEPTWREDHLLRLLKERLHRIELTAPVIALRLEASNVKPAAPPSDTLFPEPGGSAEDHTRLVELLVARLGEENVLRPAPTADHRPEIANRWVPVTQPSKPLKLPHGLPRPTWLLDTPVRLLMRQHRPFYGSPLRMVSPGERIETGWFDDENVARDYFVAQADDQSCYWIFRDRVSSRDAEDEQRWFLHGLFG